MAIKQYNDVDINFLNTDHFQTKDLIMICVLFAEYLHYKLQGLDSLD